jgi:hypothetical protein
MDVLEKNMIIQTNEPLINYGSIEETQHTLVGYVTSSDPFILTLLGDGVTILSPQIAEPVNIEKSSYIMNVNRVFYTGTNKFQLKLEGTQFDIHLQLWKPYPISQVLPN